MEERMSNTEHAAWTQSRKRGGAYYVLRHGVLTKGVVFAILMSVVQWFGLLGSAVNKPAEVALRFVALALLYGGINGWLEWRSEESRYRQGPESDDPDAESVCLACHAVLPQGQSRCPSCGWSYENDP